MTRSFYREIHNPGWRHFQAPMLRQRRDAVWEWNSVTVYLIWHVFFSGYITRNLFLVTEFRPIQRRLITKWSSSIPLSSWQPNLSQNSCFCNSTFKIKRSYTIWSSFRGKSFQCFFTCFQYVCRYFWSMAPEVLSSSITTIRSYSMF